MLCCICSLACSSVSSRGPGMNMDVEMDMERMSESMSVTSARPVLQGVP